jgi:hypothetical protein
MGRKARPASVRRTLRPRRSKSFVQIFIEIEYLLRQGGLGDLAAIDGATETACFAIAQT